MKKVYLMLLLSVMFFVLVFAGCTQTGATEGKATPTPSSTTEKSYIKAGETYRYLRWDFKTPEDYLEGTGTGADYIRETHNKLQDKYGITISYVPGPGGDWVENVLSLAYAGTPTTDIVHAGGPFALTSFYMYKGTAASAIYSLSELKDAATFSDPEYWDTDMQNTLGTFDGELYFAVPANTGGSLALVNQVTFFNKSILDAAGYTDKQLYDWHNEGNWTWERFKEIAIKTTDADAGIFGTTVGEQSVFMYSLIASNDSAFIAPKEVDGKTVDQMNTLDPKAIAAYDFFADLINAKAIDSEGGAEAPLFASGRYAMMLTYLNRGPTLQKLEMEADFGVLLPPKGPDAPDYISDINWMTPYCILRGIPNPMGTAELMEQLFQPMVKKSSPESMAMLEIDLDFLRDKESLDICKTIPEKSRASRFMLYWTANNYEFANAITGDAVKKIASGEATATNYFSSVNGRLDALLLDLQTSN